MRRPADPVLEMRLPLWSRVSTLAVLVIVLAILSDALRQQGGIRIWAAVFAVLATVLSWRTAGLALAAGREEMVVRNTVRSVTLARSEVTGFHIGQGGRAGNRMIYAERGDDRPVRLEVTTELHLLASGRERLRRRLDQLEAWRVGSTPKVGA